MYRFNSVFQGNKRKICVQYANQVTAMQIISQVFLELGSGFSMTGLANKFRSIEAEMSFIELITDVCNA